MTDSDFVYEQGIPIDVGNPVEQGFVYDDDAGKLLSDGDVSQFAFIEGRGLGATGKFTLSDSGGSETGRVGIIEQSKTVEDFYDYEPNLYAKGDVLNYAKDKTASFMLYENTSTGTVSLIGIYDNRNSDSGGDLDLSFSNVPSGVSFAVEDDPGSATADVYSLNPPSAFTEHTWTTNRTDGWAIKDLSGASGTTITIDVTALGSRNGEQLQDVRAIGPDGTVGPRSISTDTSIDVSLP